MPKKQRVNMDLDKDLWKRVGMKALELDMQKKELVETALNQYIQEHKEEKEMNIMLSTDAIVEKYMRLALENDAPFTYHDTKFVNLNRLYDFIAENEKHDHVDFEEVLKELLKDGAEKGWGSYELGSWETKNGNPATIDYDYESEDDENGEFVSETITF